MQSGAAPKGRTAAFYDVEGTLVSTNVVHTYALYAVNTPGIAERVGRFASLLAAIPGYWLLDRVNRRLFNETFYRRYEGISEDRLVILGEEFCEEFLAGRVFDGVAELIERSRRAGHLQVFVTGALDYIIAPFARRLGIDHWVTNRLEIVGGKATGHLVPPVIAGPGKAAWILQFAASHGIDLTRSFAYADSASDIPMLSVVGTGCAVNPDRGLRRLAMAHNWPVLRFG